jgi:hypothetical protein
MGNLQIYIYIRFPYSVVSAKKMEMSSCMHDALDLIPKHRQKKKQIQKWKGLNKKLK